VPTRTGHSSTGAQSRCDLALSAQSQARVEREIGVQDRSPAYGSRLSGRIARTVAAGDA
jgi:hypothetical protein